MSLPYVTVHNRRLRFFWGVKFSELLGGSTFPLFMGGALQFSWGGLRFIMGRLYNLHLLGLYFMGGDSFSRFLSLWGEIQYASSDYGGRANIFLAVSKTLTSCLPLPPLSFQNAVHCCCTQHFPGGFKDVGMHTHLLLVGSSCSGSFCLLVASFPVARMGGVVSLALVALAS